MMRLWHRDIFIWFVCIAIGLSVTINLITYTWNDWGLNLKAIVIYSLPATLVSSLIAYLLCFRVIWNRIVYQKIWIKAFLFGLSLLIGVWATLNQTPPALPITHTLEIRATGERNPISESRKVMVLGVFNSDGQPLSIKDFTLQGNWKKSGNGLRINPDQISSLFWQGRTNQDLTVQFATQADAGKVALNWDGVEQKLDLFSDTPGLKTIVLPARNYYSNLSQYKIISSWTLPLIASIVCGGFISWMILCSIFLLIWDWEVKFFLNVNVPLIVLVFHFVSFTILHAYVLSIPIGVNFVFISISLKYFSILAAGSFITFYAIVKLKMGGKLEIRKQKEKIDRGDFLLLLLPLTPVVQYIIKNQEILSPIGSLFVLAIFIVFSGIYVFAIPVMLSFVGSIRILISLSLAFVYTITSMASLSYDYAWFEQGNLTIQLIFFGSVFLLTWLFFDLNKRMVLRLLIFFIFLTNSTMQLLTLKDKGDESSKAYTESKLLSLIGAREPVITPSIYLLVYDAYVPNEIMLNYDIDNSTQEKYLKELGFKLYPHTYSVARDSIGTMSRVLNASNEFYGNARGGVSGDGIIQNTLSSFGYKTYGIFQHDYFFLETIPTYDYYFPGRPSSPGILSRAILMGEFKFDIGFNKVQREEYIEKKQKVFESNSGRPKFIYTHSNLPGHTQNSGVCLPDEIDNFAKKLTLANIEMRQDIENIIDNDHESIIIIAGDHGPYLTKNCTNIEIEYEASDISRLDIQDRFGTFLAIKWPTEDSSIYDNITVLQDIFPAIFAYIFEDEQILDSKVDSTTFSNLVTIQNGIIHGGINDGEPLFLTDN